MFVVGYKNEIMHCTLFTWIYQDFDQPVGTVWYYVDLVQGVISFIYNCSVPQRQTRSIQWKRTSTLNTWIVSYIYHISPHILGIDGFVKLHITIIAHRHFQKSYRCNYRLINWFNELIQHGCRSWGREGGGSCPMFMLGKYFGQDS